LNNLNNKKIKFNKLSFSLIKKENQWTQMGLVVLATDLTIETETRYFLSQGSSNSRPISLMHSRIQCDDKVTSSNLEMMQDRFSESLALFPSNYAFDVIGYGCTSASLLIGEQKIMKIIKSYVNVREVTTPLTAVKRGLNALGAKKIGYLAPYISEISLTMCQNLSAEGFEISAAATFGEDKDSVVGNITPSSIMKAIDSLVETSKDLEAIFVSCTSLKCAQIIPIMEKKYNIPIISSNSAIAWDMARLGNSIVSAKGKGALFSI